MTITTMLRLTSGRFLCATTSTSRSAVLLRRVMQPCVQQAVAHMSTSPAYKKQPRTEAWTSSSRRHRGWGELQKGKPNQSQGGVAQQLQIPRLQPQKYKSLVYLPNNVTLRHPSEGGNRKFELECMDFAIAKPGHGGHVLLGPNGSGKSLLVHYLSNPELFEDTLNQQEEDWKLLHPSEVAYVSFESHLQVLKDQPYLTVHDAITGGVGNLTKVAQYLAVRFGLKPLLHRTVSTLSTGEIRKTLLVSALSQEPSLLVLENPFDGLDVQSRLELKAIVSKTIKGLGQSGKLLVQAVNAEYVPPAQVFMSTHRPEEIVDELTTISLILENPQQGSKPNLVTVRRPREWSTEQLMYTALGMDKDHNKNNSWSVLAPWQADDQTLPSVEDLQTFWNDENNTNNSNSQNPVMALENVEIRRRRDGVVSDKQDDEDQSEFVTLLHPFSWNIEQGERWLIAGGNGAGKSTLSRFLLHSQDEGRDDVIVDEHDTTCDISSGTYSKDSDARIGWVSTESHLGKVTMDGTSEELLEKTAWEVMSHNGVIAESVVNEVVSWVFGGDSTSKMISILKSSRLEELSQGQQKLVLIASALAERPNVLVLDEPTQGLDWINRRRVLALLERIMQATSTSLIYITHYPEEWIPSISHVLHLDRGHVVFQGLKRDYKPERL